MGGDVALENSVRRAMLRWGDRRSLEILTEGAGEKVQSEAPRKSKFLIKRVVGILSILGILGILGKC